MGPGSWRGLQRSSSVHSSLKGGGDTIPSEVAWRGLLAQAEDAVLPSCPRGAAPLADPIRRSTCRASPGSLAAEERTGAPHSRALPRRRARATILARFSPTSKFIHKTLRLSQPKVGELGRECESLSLPSPPLGDRGPVARPESTTASISPRTRRMCGEGWAKGDGSWEARRHCEGWGGSREEEGRDFNSGFTLFQIGV